MLTEVEPLCDLLGHQYEPALYSTGVALHSIGRQGQNENRNKKVKIFNLLWNDANKIPLTNFSIKNGFTG